jgi:hypothetical protein
MTISSTLPTVVKGVVVSTVQAECPACKHHVVIALPASVPEAESLYGKGRIHNVWLLLVVLAATLACLLTVFALAAHLGDSAFSRMAQRTLLNLGFADTKALLTGCWAFWVLAPPVWFAFEYFGLFKPTSGSFAALKYGQEQATKAWAAVVVILSSVLLAISK